MSKTVLCPRCGEKNYTPYGEDWTPDAPLPPALSRVDNKTYICSDCGTAEALLDFTGAGLTPLDEWAVPPLRAIRYTEEAILNVRTAIMRVSGVWEITRSHELAEALSEMEQALRFLEGREEPK